MAKINDLFQTASYVGRNDTFMGVERIAPDEVPERAIAVIGIPGATPYASAGAYCRAAPEAIRNESARYSSTIMHHNFDLGGALLPKGARLFDVGDLEFDSKDFGGNRKRIRTTVNMFLTRSVVPVVLGGDDSVQIPVIEAFASQSEITILQIDAHIDWRDEVQSERFGLSSTMRRASEMAGVKTIVQVGARGVGSARTADMEAAIAYGVRLFDMQRIRREGIAAAVDAIPTDAPVVVCLDVDGLDPSVVPGVIGRSPGGLTYGEVAQLITGAAGRAPIIGFNIVELVPENDIDGQGVLVAARLCMLGIGLAARAQFRHASQDLDP